MTTIRTNFAPHHAAARIRPRRKLTEPVYHRSSHTLLPAVEDGDVEFVTVIGRQIADI